jgi:hypothetical protein
MSKSESTNQEILNLPANADLGGIRSAAREEGQTAQTDTPESLLNYEFGKLELENKRLEDENERLRDIHELRKEYIPKLFTLLVFS